MRARLIAVLVVIGAAALVLGPTPGLTQPPGGSRRGGFDPDQFFDRMAQGGDSVSISSFTIGRDRAEEWARRNGINNGRMSREQFRAYMGEVMGSMRRLGGGGSERRDGPSDSRDSRGNGDYGRNGDSRNGDSRSGDSRGGYGDRERGYGDRERGYGDRERGYGDRGYGDRERGYGDRGYGDRDRGSGDRDRGYGDRDRGSWDPGARAEELFRRSDRDGDGFLNSEEMSESLQAERDKWDVNKDGSIEAGEFRDYIRAWHERRQADRDERDRDRPGESSRDRDRDGPGYLPPGASIDQGERRPAETKRKAVVYRADKLPDGLPKWFREYDANKDAQVALYEWKDQGGAVRDFREKDLNGDGLITVEEMLRVGGNGHKDDNSSGDSERGNGSNDRGNGNGNGNGNGDSGRTQVASADRRDDRRDGREDRRDRRDDRRDERRDDRRGPPGQGSSDSRRPGPPMMPGMGNMDPNKLFEDMAKGKSYIVIDEVTDRMRRGAMTDWAKKNNVTNGQMTRDQYLAYFKERTSGGGGGMFNMFRRGGGGGGPRGR